MACLCKPCEWPVATMQSRLEAAILSGEILARDIRERADDWKVAQCSCSMRRSSSLPPFIILRHQSTSEYHSRRFSADRIQLECFSSARSMAVLPDIYGKRAAQCLASISISRDHLLHFPRRVADLRYVLYRSCSFSWEHTTDIHSPQEHNSPL